MTASEALAYLKERKPDVQPSHLFLQQINDFYGRKEKIEIEDPMIRFHRRLQERKAAMAPSTAEAPVNG